MVGVWASFGSGVGGRSGNAAYLRLPRVGPCENRALQNGEKAWDCRLSLGDGGVTCCLLHAPSHISPRARKRKKKLCTDHSPSFLYIPSLIKGILPLRTPHRFFFPLRAAEDALSARYAAHLYRR